MVFHEVHSKAMGQLRKSTKVISWLYWLLPGRTQWLYKSIRQNLMAIFVAHLGGRPSMICLR